MTDAITHYAARPFEQPRPFEQLVFRRHRTRADDFFAVEDVGHNGDRLHGNPAILPQGPVSGRYCPALMSNREARDREQFFWDRLRDGRAIVLPDGGDAPTQWAYVEDVAEACVRAIEVPDAVGQAFNVAHVEPMTQRTFVEALAGIARIEPTLVSVPRRAIAAAGGQLVGDRLYFGEYLDIPPHTEVVEKAPRLLGVNPTSFETALRAGFAWYTAQPRRRRDYSFEDGLIAQA